MAAQAETWVINERVLTDDEVAIAPPGHTFKGGYVAVLTYHTYLNSNSDEPHVRRFRTFAAAARYIWARYGDDADWDILEGFTPIDRPA